MKFQRVTSLHVATALIGTLAVTFAWCAEPSSDAANQPVEVPRVSVATARDRAKLMHDVYISTLDSMHRYYFQANRSVLPARALEDVFEEIAELDKIDSRWIAVNTPAMSVNHEPSTKFEKDAAAAIAAGKGEFELVENGVYRRAGAIALADGCVSCHTGFATNRPTSQRFAGLVISMPVETR